MIAVFRGGTASIRLSNMVGDTPLGMMALPDKGGS
jgi:hypothetical protein